MNNYTDTSRLADFVQGFRALMPLWLGGAPVAVAYAYAAKQAGLSGFETQFMSLTVFSSTTQLSILQAMGGSFLSYALNGVIINFHYLLYGVALTQRYKLRRWERILAAFLMSDGAYGVSQTRTTSFSYFLGAAVSMYTVWNVFTALGLLLHPLVASLSWAHLEFSVPLIYFALLVSAVKKRVDLAVAIFSVVCTLIALRIGLGGGAVLFTGIVGAAFGVWMTRK